MHVTLVSSIDPNTPQAGGTRTYVLGLAERLPRHGVEVCLIARDRPRDPITGIRYVRISSGPSNVRFLLRLLTAGPDIGLPKESIIHSQRPDGLAPFAYRRGPTVCTLHGIPSRSIRRRGNVLYSTSYGLLERFGLPRADRIIAVSLATAEWYRDRYPRLADRIVVIPPGVDTSRFRPMDREAARHAIQVREEHAVLYAGRLSREKRVEFVVRALTHVPATELLIAGEGAEESKLRAMARNAPVRFLGTIPHDRMPQLLNGVDLVVLPSEFEGLPTIALEALACGTPVVATPVGALPEILIPGKTGWLVPDPVDFGRAIAEALPEAKNMASACVAAARPYSWDTVVDRPLAVYREAEAAA